MSSKIVRGRFAPTPSGRMHLGNVFTALLAWLSVRSQNGEMILRIEDIDRARCKPMYIETLVDDLAFLGLDYDEGEDLGGPYAPYRQSERTVYRDAMEQLYKKHLIYPCFCSRDELHAVNAPHASDGRVIYNGRCRTLSNTERAAQTRSPAFRVIADNEDITFHDGLYGFQRGNIAADWGDFIVRRSDGMYAYQLAVVVDDAQMGITEVVRGCDLLDSTFPQLQLYRQLDLTAPSFTHVPMLLSTDGRRLSKRDSDVDMGMLRANGTTAETIIGYLLFACGILDRPCEISAKEAISEFSWNRVVKHDIIVDISKITNTANV